MKMKSQRGTNSMKPESPNFNSKQLCSIIKECAASGVSSLSVGGVKIEFYSKFPQTTPVLGLDEQSQPSDLEREKLVAVIEEQARRLETIRKKEEEQENLPILDPLAWEESESEQAWKAETHG